MAFFFREWHPEIVLIMPVDIQFLFHLLDLGLDSFLFFSFAHHPLLMSFFLDRLEGQREITKGILDIQICVLGYELLARVLRIHFSLHGGRNLSYRIFTDWHMIVTLTKLFSCSQLSVHKTLQITCICIFKLVSYGPFSELVGPSFYRFENHTVWGWRRNLFANWLGTKGSPMVWTEKVVRWKGPRVFLCRTYL